MGPEDRNERGRAGEVDETASFNAAQSVHGTAETRAPKVVSVPPMCSTDPRARDVFSQLQGWVGGWV